MRHSAQDAAAARVLAGGADRDVAEIREEIRDFRQATTSSFNAMREDLDDLRTRVGDGFAQVDRGFTEMRGKLDATAAGGQQIVHLLNTLIAQHGGQPNARVWQLPDEGLGDDQTAVGGAKPGGDADGDVGQGVAAGALLEQAQGFVAERGVGGQRAAEAGAGQRHDRGVGRQAGQEAEQQRPGDVDGEGAPGEHRVVAGLDRPVGQVAQRRADRGTDRDEQQDHRASARARPT